MPYEISVISADHEGIVHQIARYLTTEKIQVETMDTHVTPAPITGTPIFSMHAMIQAPPELSLPALRHKLTELGDELGADIEVRVPVN